MLDDNDYNPSDKSHSVFAEEEEEDLVIPHAASSSDSEDSASAVPTSIKTVWETKKFEKIVDNKGCKMWQSIFSKHGTTPRLGTMSLEVRMLPVARRSPSGGRFSLHGLLPRRNQRRLSKTLMTETWLFQ